MLQSLVGQKSTLFSTCATSEMGGSGKLAANKNKSSTSAVSNDESSTALVHSEEQQPQPVNIRDGQIPIGYG